jgi:hypothetical protein
MRFPIARTLPVLALAAAAAGFTHAPVGAAAQPAVSASPLQVYVTCRGTWCDARARGGSGVYLEYEWQLADGSGPSADASPYCQSGLILGPSVTVTDSNGATASGSDLVFCP